MSGKMTILLFFALICTGWSAIVKVPVYWQGNRDWDHIREVGFYQDQEKYVIGLRFADLQNWQTRDNFRISIYSDIDNDLSTGRFPGKAGWDFQANCRISRKQLNLTRWIGNKSLGIPLYRDDYLIETTENNVYFVFKKNPLKNFFTFAPKFSLRFLVSAQGRKNFSLNVKIHNRRKDQTLQPPLNFINFSSSSGAFIRKKAEAHLLYQNGKIKVWNSFGERYEIEEPAPAMVKQEKALIIKGAQGEAEAGHIGISCEFPVKQLKASLSLPFTNSGRKTLPAECCRIYYLEYIRNIYEKGYPDALRENYVPQKTRHQFITLDISIPQNAEAGIYNGQITLLINQTHQVVLPVELEVFGFRMPDRPFFRTAYCLKPAYIRNHFRTISSEEALAEAQAQKKLAKQYRFSPRLLERGPRFQWDEKGLRMDWKNYDQSLQKYFHEDRFTCLQDSYFQMGSQNRPNNKFLPIESPEFPAWFGAMVKARAEHYKKLGVLDRILFVIWDEPYSAMYDKINRACEIARKAAPEIKWGVFIDHFAPEIAENIDIWLSDYSMVAKLRRQPAQAQKRVWVYNNIGMNRLDLPAAVLRSYYWLAWHYDIEGYLYSEINGYQSPYHGKNPNDYYATWLNHCWLYPGKKPGNPAASLRMLLSREGLDDYDYLVLYSQIKPQGQALDDLKKAVPILAGTGDLSFPVVGNLELQKLKYRIAGEIAGK